MQEEIPNKYHGVPGHLKMKEAEYLYNAPFRLGDGNYANIGTYRGRSAVHMAGGFIESKIKGVVVSVDIKEKGASKYFALHEVDHVIEYHLIGSVETAKLYPEGGFRCVFIDANHSYEGVKADFEAWSPLVETDGEIAFHDSFDSRLGVCRFLKELEDEGIWEKIDEAVLITCWRRV